MKKITGAMLIAGSLMIALPVVSTGKPVCEKTDEADVTKCTETYYTLGFERHRTFWIKKIHGRMYSFEEYPGVSSRPTPYNWPSDKK